MGTAQGQSMQNGFNGYIFLQFWKPAQSGSLFGALTYRGTFVSTASIQALLKCYISAFYSTSPSQVYISIILGLSNEGSYVDSADGQAWGNLVEALDSWIQCDEYCQNRGDKVAVLGGIDNEIAINPANKSLDWRSGYVYSTGIAYIYYGDCTDCPYVDASGVFHNTLPSQWGWTLQQIYTMASGEGSIAMPQIYRRDNKNAFQWDYLTLTTRIANYYPPMAFAGSTTEWDACLEVDNCFSGTSNAIDNTPEMGWESLYGALNDPSDPRTFQNNIPFSTDMSWDHMKVSVSR